MSPESESRAAGDVYVRSGVKHHQRRGVEGRADALLPPHRSRPAANTSSHHDVQERVDLLLSPLHSQLLSILSPINTRFTLSKLARSQITLSRPTHVPHPPNQAASATPTPARLLCSTHTPLESFTARVSRTLRFAHSSVTSSLHSPSGAAHTLPSPTSPSPITPSGSYRSSTRLYFSPVSKHYSSIASRNESHSWPASRVGWSAGRRGREKVESKERNAMRMSDSADDANKSEGVQDTCSGSMVSLSGNSERW